jgi:hypothetical protein
MTRQKIRRLTTEFTTNTAIITIFSHANVYFAPINPSFLLLKSKSQYTPYNPTIAYMYMIDIKIQIFSVLAKISFFLDGSR